jgi:hypothetical protein
MSLDVFREVDEAYRRDQFISFCQRNQRPLSLTVGVLLLSSLLYVGWQQVAIKRQTQQSAQYSSALQQLAADKIPEAEANLAQLSAKNGGYATLARLQLASVYDKNKKAAESLAELQKMAQDHAVDAPLRNYARYIAAQRLLEQGGSVVDPAKLQEWLKPLLAEDGAWSGLAEELVGLAYLQTGQLEQARQHLEKIAVRKEVPIATRERADRLLALVYNRLNLPAHSMLGDADHGADGSHVH